MRIPAIMVAALFCASVPANAQWQYTHWGMSPKEVVSASKGLAIPPPTQDHDENQKLEAPYKTDDFSFRALFEFDKADRLTGVQLRLTKGDPSALLHALRNKYGTPDNDSSKSVFTALLWRTKSDVVSIMGAGDAWALSYAPRDGQGSLGKGL